MSFNNLKCPGKIKLFLGPMFSGKSSRLIETIRKYVYKNLKTTMVGFYADRRYTDESEVVTHDLIKYSSISCKTLSEIHDELMKYDVIGIDEGQFFPDLVEECEFFCKAGKIVVVAALSGDFKMEPFENISRLISKADKIELMRAYCYFCQKKAGFSLRTINSDKTILIGSAECYRPVCKECHYKYNINKKEDENKQIEYKNEKASISSEIKEEILTI